MTNVLRQRIARAFLRQSPRTTGDVLAFKRRIAKIHGTPIFTNSTLIKGIRQQVKTETPKVKRLLKLLRIADIRTLSGVAIVTVLTKSYRCPGRCIYCPTWKNMPKSYIDTEPAAQRALLNQFDPYRQVTMRLTALRDNGHATDKIELIVLGGTWSAYEPRYQTWFIRRCFDAANDFHSKKTGSRTLKTSQTKNEKAVNRIIGLTLETRPDWITKKEIVRLRMLGCTRMQIGVQTIDDRVLDLVKRGHHTDAVIRATKLLKDAGLKVSYHLMQGLPGTTPSQDVDVARRIFTESAFMPDHVKLYPTVVVKHSVLYTWWKLGKYKPLTDRQLTKLIPRIKQHVPSWVRIERIVRDIPSTDIEAGNKITNFRQLLHEEMKRKGVRCKCIRCREPRKREVNKRNVKLVRRDYRASGGKEIFLSYESKDGTTIYAFLRLRFPSSKKHYINALNNAAIIRELHTYGELVPLQSKKKKVQHAGFGKRLMAEAERIAQEDGYGHMAVISGIGVREYYRKIGYSKKDEYMVKMLP